MGCQGAGNGVLWKWYSGGLMGSHWEIAPDHVRRNLVSKGLAREQIWTRVGGAREARDFIDF